MIDTQEFEFQCVNNGQMKFAFINDDLWLFKYKPMHAGWMTFRKATPQDLQYLKTMQKIKQDFVFDVDVLMNNPRRA